MPPVIPSPTPGATRRAFLKSLGAGVATVLVVPGCGYYAAESCGEAYEPWSFPGDEIRPEHLAVRAALLAASPHNTQPWRFELSAGRIDLWADTSRSLGAMDGRHREMYLGLGCALENLVIAARQHGREPQVTLLPDALDETHVATIDLTAALPAAQELYPAITERHTNRGRYLDADAPAGLEAALRAQVLEPEVGLTFVGTAAPKAAFRQGTIDATQAIVGDREMNEASHAWWRQTCSDIDTHRDGMTLDATGQSSSIRFLGKVVSAPDADAAGAYWIDLTKGQQTTASAFGVLATPDRDSRREQLVCGRVYQRLHLWATSQGLGVQPLNQMAERQDREQALGLPLTFTTQLRQLLGSSAMGAQMLFRVGYAWDRATRSPRRPLAWVTP